MKSCSTIPWPLVEYANLRPRILCVFLSLLKAIARILVICLCLNDGNGKVRAIAKKIIGSFLFAADRAVARDNDAAIGESPLFIDEVISPASSVELREDVFSRDAKSPAFNCRSIARRVKPSRQGRVLTNT